MTGTNGREQKFGGKHENASFRSARAKTGFGEQRLPPNLWQE